MSDQTFSPMPERSPGNLVSGALHPNPSRGAGDFCRFSMTSVLVRLTTGVAVSVMTKGASSRAAVHSLLYRASRSSGATSLRLPAAVRWMKVFSRLPGPVCPVAKRAEPRTFSIQLNAAGSTHDLSAKVPLQGSPRLVLTTTFPPRRARRWIICVLVDAISYPFCRSTAQR